MALTAKVAEAEATIDGELASLDEQRAPLVALVDPALLTRYEGLRKRFNGVGVARLDGTPYLPSHVDGGLLVAVDRESWADLRREVFTF